jgi:methionyl aminopeptidase
MTYSDANEGNARVSGQIRLYKQEEFEGMRVAGHLAAACLDMITPYMVEGASTQKIDDLIREFTFDNGALPATLYYRGYTKSSCISLNHVVCHGTPSAKPLTKGDIANVDVTLIVNGWHGDTSRMYPIGQVNRKAERLIVATYEAMMKGIAVVKPGNFLGDIGYAIQHHVEPLGFSVVRDFCGHGVGKLFHDEPNVVHYGQRKSGPELKPGMIFTIEPMINAGKFGVKILPDGWTAVTRDKSLSAQFEHSIGVTETGVEIFTTSPSGLHHPIFSA